MHAQTLRDTATRGGSAVHLIALKRTNAAAVSLAVVQDAAAPRTGMRARSGCALPCQLFGTVARTPALRHLHADTAAGQQRRRRGVGLAVRTHDLTMQGLHGKKFFEDTFAMAAADIV